MGLSWLEDETILYEQAQDGLRIVQIPEDGGEPLVVYAEADAPIWVHGLPDARGALVTTLGPRLYLVDLREMSAELILEQVVRAWYSPTGHIVYVRADGALFAVPFDLGALEITGSAFPYSMECVSLRTERMCSSRPTERSYTWKDSPPRWQTCSSSLSSIWRVTTNLSSWLRGLSRGVGVGWSPDGRSVVFVSEGQIYTYNVSLGTTPRQLTFEGNNGWPVFSPDGTRVAFSSLRDGTD